MAHSPDLFSHSSNVSNIFDESLNQSTSSSLDTETQRLSQTHIDEPRTPGANVVYKGSMRGQSPEAGPSEQAESSQAGPSRAQTAEGSSRENDLILERDRLRTLNGILENTISTFQGAQDKMQVRLTVCFWSSADICVALFANYTNDARPHGSLRLAVVASRA